MIPAHIPGARYWAAVARGLRRRGMWDMAAAVEQRVRLGARALDVAQAPSCVALPSWIEMQLRGEEETKA